MPVIGQPTGVVTAPSAALRENEDYEGARLNG
jgi:hypothetical protein